MLKIKRGKNSHRSRTVDDAIKDVKKEELVQVSFWIPKNQRLKFRRKAEDMGSSAAEELRKYITSFIAD